MKKCVDCKWIELSGFGGEFSACTFRAEVGGRAMRPTDAELREVLYREAERYHAMSVTATHGGVRARLEAKRDQLNAMADALKEGSDGVA